MCSTFSREVVFFVVVVVFFLNKRHLSCDFDFILFHEYFSIYYKAMVTKSSRLLFLLQ